MQKYRFIVLFSQPGSYIYIALLVLDISRNNSERTFIPAEALSPFKYAAYFQEASGNPL